MLYTKTITSKDYFQNFRKSVREIKSHISLLESDESIFLNSKSEIFYIDRYAESLQCLHYEEKLSKIISDLLVKQSISVSEIAPFFEDFSVIYTVNLLTQLVLDKLSDANLDNIDEYESLVLSGISTSSSIGTSVDFFHFINKLNRTEVCRQIIENSCRYAGLDGKIFIEPSKTGQTSLEVKNSYSFSVETFDEFFFESGGWDHAFARCIVIDGIIESVSEIHHLLEQSSNNIDPVVLIARGFGDEVLQTLYVNMKRKMLNVFPVKLKTNESLINSFVDIAIVSNTDPVSYLKGELISSIEYDKTSIVDHVEIKKGKLLIVNNSSMKSTRYHLERLRRTIEEKRNRLDTYSFDLYESSIRDRIRSLSSKCVHISLNENISSQEIRKMRKDIDGSLKTIPVVRDYGVTNLKSLEKNLDNQDNKNKILLSTLFLFFKETKAVPAGSLVRVLKICHENIKLLIQTSGAIVSENAQK